jgi:hypothetical protein
MALTNIEIVRLEIGLVGEAYDLLTDDEITYYLTKNNDNTSKTARDCAKTVLFILSQRVHEKADVLEIWGHDWFNNYYKSLQLYLNDPSYSTAINNATPYAGGVSRKDIRQNIDNFDNQVVDVNIGIPTDIGVPCSWNTSQDVFKKDPFSIW